MASNVWLLGRASGWRLVLWQRRQMARLRIGIVVRHALDMTALDTVVVVHIGLFAGVSKPLDVLGLAGRALGVWHPSLWSQCDRGGVLPCQWHVVEQCAVYVPAFKADGEGMTTILV